jgi:hypothetical protein
MTRLWPQGERIQISGPEASSYPRNGGTTPLAFDHQGQSHRIVDICNRWQIHTRWWEPDRCVWREYLKTTTDMGLLCLIYHDLLSDEWYIARIYD